MYLCHHPTKAWEQSRDWEEALSCTSWLLQRLSLSCIIGRYLFIWIGPVAGCWIHCGKYSCVATCSCFPRLPFPPPQTFPEMKIALKVLLTPVLPRAHLDRDSVLHCGFQVRSWELSHSDISQLSSHLRRLQQSSPKVSCQVPWIVVVADV